MPAEDLAEVGAGVQAEGKAAEKKARVPGGKVRAARRQQQEWRGGPAGHQRKVQQQICTNSGVPEEIT